MDYRYKWNIWNIYPPPCPQGTQWSVHKVFSLQWSERWIFVGIPPPRALPGPDHLTITRTTFLELFFEPSFWSPFLCTPAPKKEYSDELGPQNDSKMEPKMEPKVIQKVSLLKNMKK